MFRLAFASLFVASALSARQKLTIPRDVNQANLRDTPSELKSCTRKQIYKIQGYAATVQNCGENKGCGGQQQRRRLADQNDMDYFTTFNCYCRKCSNSLAALQTACNACDAINYVDPCADGGNNNNNNNNNNNCDNQNDNDYGEWSYQEACVVQQFMLASHQDTFCDMMSGSKTCLKEMEYMINPPEEEEDDNNNNNRRRLKDDDNREEDQVDAQQLVECWQSPLMGGESYNSLTRCANVCAQYGNSTYDYIYNGKEDPVQLCGLSISAYDENSETSELLPTTLRHSGVACVSSSCSDEDAANIMQYVATMAAYSSFLMFGGDEEDQNRDQQEGQYFYDYTKTIPVMKANWMCSGGVGEGEIVHDGYPDEDEECQEKKKEQEEEKNTMEARWATATTFAIIFALGMGVFACLYLHYYRKYSSMKQSQSGNQSLIENQQTGQPVSYGGTSAPDEQDI